MPQVKRVHKSASRFAGIAWRRLRFPMIRSRHQVHRLSKTRLTCLCCGETAVGRLEVSRWLRGGVCKGSSRVLPKGCPPPPTLPPHTLAVAGRTHATHRVQVRKGVVMCVCCGAFGSRRPRMFKQACLGRLNAGRRAALKRWGAGLHPNPKGVWMQPPPREARADALEVSSGSD